ncbi:hypothetical protein ALSL_1392 [Aerosticca soli]|uniref:Uncharacterized protein n=1 Tax=Aerosticca soli TaxID=2010829 RepID=A0A2Z6E6D9_9GAMM|nr:hypothetical protein ALSL_1392 [Aerosticca soli]
MPLVGVEFPYRGRHQAHGDTYLLVAAGEASIGIRCMMRHCKTITPDPRRAGQPDEAAFAGSPPCTHQASPRLPSLPLAPPRS